MSDKEKLDVLLAEREYLKGKVEGYFFKAVVLMAVLVFVIFVANN